jgi:cell wall-associated NlpC family hydrolase
MWDNGVLVKRTTARKLYMSLPKAGPGQELRFGNIVFFDNLKHCGIVNGRDSFYHAATTQGTSLSRFEPYWGSRVCGFRRIRLPQSAGRGPRD